MNAIPAPSARSLSRSGPRGVWRACVLLALVTSFPSVAQELVAAVWQPRKVSFSYGSSTTLFTCNALAGRVASILRAVGARDDVEVTTSGCSVSGPPSPPRTSPIGTWDPMTPRASARSSEGRQYVNLYIRLMLPTEVTPEVLAELKKDKSRRELVARVTGNPAARFNDPVMFHAQWQPVTLSHKTIGITIEECELLDQMSPGVFRELGLRVAREGFICSPDSNLPPEMVVEALLPTPSQGSSVPEMPESIQKDVEPSAPADSRDDDKGKGDSPSDGQ